MWYVLPLVSILHFNIEHIILLPLNNGMWETCFYLKLKIGAAYTAAAVIAIATALTADAAAAVSTQRILFNVIEKYVESFNG